MATQEKKATETIVAATGAPEENAGALAPSEETATSKAASGGGSWRDVIGKRNSDLNLDDDAAVGDYLNGQFSDLDRANEVNSQMNDLISSDSRNAGLLSGVFTGKDDDGNDFDLVSYILQNWGDELRDAATTDEAIAKVHEKMANEEEKAQKEAERQGEIESNLQQSDADLTAAVQEVGADNATIGEMLDWLYGSEDEEGLIMRIAKRSIDQDDWTKLLYAFQRDSELEKANTQGRTEGRNSRPGATHRGGAEVATDLGGGGSEATTDEIEANPTAARYAGMKPRFNS